MLRHLNAIETSIVNLPTAADPSPSTHIHLTTLDTTPKIDKSEQRDPAYQTRQLSGLAIRSNHRIGRLQNGPGYSAFGRRGCAASKPGKI